jgi:hypothetical protein
MSATQVFIKDVPNHNETEQLAQALYPNAAASEIPLGFPAQNLRKQFNIGLGRTGGNLCQ